MFGWLKTKGENSRVYMCTKEVKWELERGDGIKSAMILALAQFFRVAMLEEIGVPQDMIDRPPIYPRDDLMRIYSAVEGMRNQNRLQLARSKKVSANIGIELPEFVEQHTKNCERALEVWMCTLGTGIQPDIRPDVRLIWQYLSVSPASLEAGVARLFEIEHMIAEMSGTPESMFEGVTAHEWIAECAFVPAMFKV